MTAVSRENITLEDIPGVGKRYGGGFFPKAMGLKENGFRFTAGCASVGCFQGFSMYKKETGTFDYRPGAAMCNLLLADEMNRTSPKTQSALLQVMEKRKLRYGGRDYPSAFAILLL